MKRQRQMCDELVYRDPFLTHFEVVKEDVVHKEEEGFSQSLEKTGDYYPIDIKCSKCTKDLSNFNLNLLHVKEKLLSNLNSLKKLSSLQENLMQIICNYMDLYFPCQSMDNMEELRLTSCLHVLNHILKSNKRIISHNKKLKDGTSGDFRDMGLTKPKAIIVVPFRDSAKKVIDTLAQLLMPNQKAMVTHRKRFHTEFSGSNDNKKGWKPADYEALFSGNSDDHFRIGVAVTKTTLKLFEDFYMSDIIVASPLGLRTLEEEKSDDDKGEKTSTYDFLSSIEIAIFDQCDVLLMQNWDHVLNVFAHLNQMPVESHGVDFTRVREWCLDGQSQQYRQTIVLSSTHSPELLNLITSKSCNHTGRMVFERPATDGCIHQVACHVTHVFHRFHAATYADAPDARFSCFKKEILPRLRDGDPGQLIFIAKYFDYVRIRNLLKKEEIEFGSACEYTKDGRLAQTRDRFFREKIKLILYTERLHFYRRFSMKGVKRIFVYELPQFPHFYPEIMNFLLTSERSENFESTVLFCKQDFCKLREVLGDERTLRMLSGENKIHSFVSEAPTKDHNDEAIDVVDDNDPS